MPTGISEWLVLKTQINCYNIFMLEIPLVIFYYIYLILVLVSLFFTFFNVYHLVRFGFLTISNIVAIAIYIFVSATILLISWNYIGQIDWQQSIPLIQEIIFE